MLFDRVYLERRVDRNRRYIDVPELLLWMPEAWNPCSPGSATFSTPTIILDVLSASKNIILTAYIHATSPFRILITSIG